MAERSTILIKKRLQQPLQISSCKTVLILAKYTRGKTFSAVFANQVLQALFN